MSDLMKKMQAAYDKVRDEAVAGVYGKRVVPDKDDEDNAENRPDFPYVDDPEGFVTHVPLEMDDLREQGEDETPPEQAAAPAPDAGGGEMPAEDPSAAGAEADMDPNDPNAMMDPNAMGGMGMPEPLTSSDLGRVYELKKIYTRLASVETVLSRTANEQMLEVRKLVGQGIDLFELVISNYPQYKDKVDEIIVTYYEFLDSVYGSLRKYFAEMSKE